MTITLKTNNQQLFDKILWLLNHFKNNDLEIIVDNKMNISNKKELEQDFFLFAGIWKDRDITQKLLREKAWKQ